MLRGFVIRYRAKARPEGRGYWVVLPDFPSRHASDPDGLLPPEVLAADMLAHAIVDHLYQGLSLPMPTPRRDGELFVEPRFHIPPLLPEEA